MKEETNRYFIVEYCGTKEVFCKTQEDVDKKFDEVRKYNRRKTSKFICGNITVQKIANGFIVKTHLYNKLTNRNTISEVDEFTSQFDENELAAFFSDKSRMLDGFTPDINIAYFETKNEEDNKEHPVYFGVKYVPVLYRDDVKYMSKKYIQSCLKYHARVYDYDFFKSLANEYCVVRPSADEVEKIFKDCDRVRYQGYNRDTLFYDALDLYTSLVYKRQRDKSYSRNDRGDYIINRRRLRDFGFFVKNYNSKNVKSPFRYNESTVSMNKEALMELRDKLVNEEGMKLTLK